MTDLVRPEKNPGFFGHFFAARAAVQEAAQVIAANVQRPDTAQVLAWFSRYAASQSGAAEAKLEKFMVLVREQLKRNEVVVDPLVMYTLQFALASATRDDVPS